MVASARVAYLSRRSSDYGVDSRPVTVSMSAVRFRRFGRQVTIVHHLLSVEDPDVADEVARILEEDGVRVLLSSEAVLANGHNAAISLTVRTNQRESILEGSHLLVAVGRRSNTDKACSRPELRLTIKASSR